MKYKKEVLLKLDKIHKQFQLDNQKILDIVEIMQLTETIVSNNPNHSDRDLHVRSIEKYKNNIDSIMSNYSIELNNKMEL